MNSFLRKVDAERKVLFVVNDYTKGKGQLAGLSSAAIDNWCSFNNIPTESETSVSLLVLADLCNSLSDRSNENFEKIPAERLDKIDSEILNLKNTLAAEFV